MTIITAHSAGAGFFETRLPRPRGPLSALVIDALRRPPRPGALPSAPPGAPEPFGEDLQLTLYVCHELRCRGFAEVGPAWAREPGLLGLRRDLEDVFLAALRASVPSAPGVLEGPLAEDLDTPGVTRHLEEEGAWWQLREYLVHHSVRHPRKRGGRTRSRLFAGLMEEAGLEPGHLYYLEIAPAVALAPANMASLFGLRRELRGALAGHLAAGASTVPGARRMARALERFGAGGYAAVFPTGRAGADGAGLGDLLRREPGLAADAVLGVRATGLLEERLGAHLLDRWRAGRGSLLVELPRR